MFLSRDNVYIKFANLIKKQLNHLKLFTTYTNTHPLQTKFERVSFFHSSSCLDSESTEDNDEGFVASGSIDHSMDEGEEGDAGKGEEEEEEGGGGVLGEGEGVGVDSFTATLSYPPHFTDMHDPGLPDHSDDYDLNADDDLVSWLHIFITSVYSQ